MLVLFAYFVCLFQLLILIADNDFFELCFFADCRNAVLKMPFSTLDFLGLLIVEMLFKRVFFNYMPECRGLMGWLSAVRSVYYFF